MNRFTAQQANPKDYGTITPTQLDILMGIASMVHGIGTHILEFGTLSGNTTINLARVLPNHQVLTCSLPLGVKPALTSSPIELAGYNQGELTFPEDVATRITHYRCDSAHLTLPLTIKLGFVFVDGGHSHDYVRNDFAKAVPFMVPGSVIVFHDYGEDGRGGISEVKRAVDDIVQQCPKWHWTEFVNHAMVSGLYPLPI